jgi:hypothetical protein
MYPKAVAATSSKNKVSMETLLTCRNSISAGTASIQAGLLPLKKL